MTRSSGPTISRSGDGPRGPVIAYSSPAELKGISRIVETIERFSITHDEMAYLLGLEPQELASAKIAAAPKTQSRLDIVLEILDRVRPWTNTDQEALGWFREMQIPALGNMTAAEAIRNDHARALRSYIEHIAVGGFA